MGRWRRVRVEGRSMLPLLRAGDRLLVREGALPRSPGDVVVVRLPGRPLSVKRAGVRDGEGWWVESENPAEGTDSWSLGAPVPAADVVGVAVLRYAPVRCARRLREGGGGPGEGAGEVAGRDRAGTGQGMTDAPAGAPGHDELPIPDYDHLPVESLQHRLRTLDLAGLERLREYESAHANRPLVLATIGHRRDELQAGAEPSGGDPAGAAPEAAPSASGGSAVTGATTGPVNNPTSQGVPTNPGQPRGSGGGSTQSPVYGD